MKNENLKISGFVRIETYNEAGQVIDVVEGENLITNLGKLNAAQLLAGSLSGKPIISMAFGTSGTAPDPADTAITSPLIKAITNYTYEAGNILAMQTTIATGDPAMVIAEVGLLNTDGVLCHRKVFDPPKTKVAGISYGVTYKIKII